MELNKKKELNIDKEVINVLKDGGVGVLPTDTLYGLVGLALNKKAVERIYKLKKRNPKKPFIILILRVKDLEKFGVVLNNFQKKFLKQVWPNEVSIILECPNIEKGLSYLRPINKTLAFRCPKEKWINNLLKKTGPLVAPSCNIEGEKPAENILEAKKYFDDKVDFYVDLGARKGEASTLVEIKDNNVKIIRQGRINPPVGG